MHETEKQIRQNASPTEALVRTADRLNAQLDLQTVLYAVCEESACALNVPVASVFLYDKQRRLMSFAGGFGLPPGWGERFPPVPYALYDELLLQGASPIVIPDVRAIPGLPGADLFAEADIRSQVSALMCREDQLVGALNVDTIAQSRRFSEDELALLEGLAHQAAQAIENARLFQETQQRLGELILLFETSTAVSSSLDVDTVLQAVARQVAAVAAAEQCTISLWNREQNALIILLDFVTRLLSGDDGASATGRPGRGSQRRPGRGGLDDRAEDRILAEGSPGCARRVDRSVGGHAERTERPAGVHVHRDYAVPVAGQSGSGGPGKRPAVRTDKPAGGAVGYASSRRAQHYLRPRSR
jgi:GAF domain-containing protein